MKNIGTINGGVVAGSSYLENANGQPMKVNMGDAAIQSNGAFLVSELEKRDEKIRQPLTSVTYHRDVPMKTGGGWVDIVSALNIDYGVTNGSGNGGVQAPGANALPVIQANLDKDTFKAHVYSVIMRIKFIDMQKSNVTGRSLDKMMQDGIRLAYDKHLDANTYIGMSEYGTQGLVNKSGVAQANVSTGAGGHTQFSTKTPDEILYDINTAISEVWANSGYDMGAVPNHIIMPHEQFNYLVTTKVSALADKTIMQYLLENNIAAKNGKELVIGGTAYCKGAGASNTDRMVVYVHHENFISEEELQPLSRTMTQPNINALAYDSVFMANVSEVEMFYMQTIKYFDGI